MIGVDCVPGEALAAAVVGFAALVPVSGHLSNGAKVAK
jgi:hypothetical protein